MRKVSAAPSATARPGFGLRACAEWGGRWESGSVAGPRAFSRFPCRPHLDRRRGRPSCCAAYKSRTSRVWGSSASEVVRVRARAFAGRSVTKSRLGGGEEERPPRSLPTLPTSPHPAREEEQFVYLGLQESFPPPCSPRPPSPSSLPSLLGAILPSPAGSTFPPPLPRPTTPVLLFLLPPSSSPPSPSLLERGRGGGSGRRFVRLAARLAREAARLGGALRPEALPLPRGRPRPAGPRSTPAPAAELARSAKKRRTRWGGRTTVTESGREVLALQTGSRKPLTHCSFSDCTRRRGRTCILTVSRMPCWYLFLSGSAPSPIPRPPFALCHRWGDPLREPKTQVVCERR